MMHSVCIPKRSDYGKAQPASGKKEISDEAIRKFIGVKTREIDLD